jgi:hypothetical protein
MMATDPDHGIHHSRTMPEELLIFSVLSRAILDLFGPVGLTSTKEEAQQAKSDALSFLTKKSGAWAKRRNDLCDAIGFDGDNVRARVIQVLEGDSTALATYDGRRELTQVAQARTLWEQEQSRSKRRKSTPKPTPQPRPRHAITRYADVRRHIMPLLTKPRTFKDLIMETNGDVSDTTIRDVLRNAVAKGEVANNDNTYLLVSVPETAVAEIAG